MELLFEIFPHGWKFVVFFFLDFIFIFILGLNAHFVA